MDHFLRPADEESHQTTDIHLVHAALSADSETERGDSSQNRQSFPLYLYDGDAAHQSLSDAVRNR